MIKDIQADNDERVGLYFDHGLDINVKLSGKDLHKRTPLHLAALQGSLNSILIMIGHGADVDPVDELGRTPLSLAIENNKFTCVRGLIELGADIE